jgi:hypothetical protein
MLLLAFRVYPFRSLGFGSAKEVGASTIGLKVDTESAGGASTNHLGRFRLRKLLNKRYSAGLQRRCG